MKYGDGKQVKALTQDTTDYSYFENILEINTTFSNGDRYVGEWKDNKMHGQGTCTYASGGKYIGEWKDNKRHGQGTYTAANKGKVYEGLWENGEFIGE